MNIKKMPFWALSGIDYNRGYFSLGIGLQFEWRIRAIAANHIHQLELYAKVLEYREDLYPAAQAIVQDRIPWLP